MDFSDAPPVEERIRALALPDQREVYAAVADGRAVTDPRLAALAIAYALRWQNAVGPRLYRSPWYLASAVVLIPIAFTTASWTGVVVTGALFGISPQLTRGRIARARRSERRNRELLCGAGSKGASGVFAAESTGAWPRVNPRVGAWGPHVREAGFAPGDATAGAPAPADPARDRR